MSLSYSQNTKLSMCFNNSSQAMTSGVESSATKSKYHAHLE
eukprot:CAMPEP_0183486544 /NCGR_PEP_ID=MMETSP0370-20130417/179988_1 /TAXON_ID=268820 /ORGANISM="Peridinium aciculiferum, Strain PAER-2" /LENGTH=40 /DNA_ID= /DNA_START= /DNA_END= /DNA_ORIENTATION=